MKEKLFEHKGGNSFKIVKESMVDYGDYEPMDSNEDPTGDLEGEVDDLLARLDPENPDPRVYDTLMRIKHKLDTAIGMAKSQPERDRIVQQHQGSLNKLSSI